MEYGKDTREELNNVVSEKNRHFKPGQEAIIDGMSINDLSGDNIVSSKYDPKCEQSIDIHDFIEQNAPETGGDYKVYVHYHTESNRGGWIEAGTARDSGVQEISKLDTSYVMVEVDGSGNVVSISSSDEKPVDGIDMNEAELNVQKRAEGYAKEILKTETKTQDKTIDTNIMEGRE